jgi:hypothetical protein
MPPTRILRDCSNQIQPQDHFPDENNNVWNISNLKYSLLEDYSLSPQKFVHRHFIREDTREIIAYLNEKHNEYVAAAADDPLPTASLEGSSGVGKSTEVWGWFQLQNGNNRLWIHRKGDTNEFKIFQVVVEDGGNESYSSGIVGAADLPKLRHNCIGW